MDRTNIYILTLPCGGQMRKRMGADSHVRPRTAIYDDIGSPCTINRIWRFRKSYIYERSHEE